MAEATMTEAVFLEWLKSDEPLGFSAAVLSLSEAERKKLSKAAQEHLKQLRKAERDGRNVSQAPQFANRVQDFERLLTPSRALAMAHIGLLAVGPKSSVLWNLPNPHRLGIRLPDDDPSPHETAAIDILINRRPEWAQEWMEQQFVASRSSYGICWTSMKRLLDSGVCKPPDSLDFAIFTHQMLLRRSLQHDSELAEMIWDQFRYSTGFWLMHGPLRKFPDGIPAKEWLSGPERIFQMIQKGQIPRAKVIDQILEAFWHEFSALERSGMTKLYEALEVTPEEIVTRQAEHCRLLANDTSPVVAFAIKCLKSIKGHADLDVDLLIEGLAGAMSIRTKSQPLAALGLLKLIANSDQGLIEKSQRIVAVALQHNESDVQSAAIGMLEKWSKFAKITPELISSAGATISPILRDRYRALLEPKQSSSARKTKDQATEESTEQGSPPSPNRVDSTELSEEHANIVKKLSEDIARLPEPIRAGFRLSESLSCSLSQSDLPEIDLEGLPFPKKVLTPLVPIRNIEELVDTINLLVEGIDSAMDVERVLDGIQVLGKNYPPDFVHRTAPILSRFEGKFSSWQQQYTFVTFPRLFRLMYRWLQQFRGQIPAIMQSAVDRGQRNRNPAIAILENRVEEVEARIANDGAPLPLLAFPSFEHGWIEPLELLDRLKAYSAAGEALPLREFETALLRLIPFSSFPVSEMSDLPEVWQRILRYASGEPPVFASEDGCSNLSWILIDGHPTTSELPASWWLAAGRTRNRRAALPELAPLSIPEIAFGKEAAKVRMRLEYSSAARELVNKELTDLRKKHSFAELERLLDPAEVGLDSVEVVHRMRLKQSLHGYSSGYKKAIQFEPMEKKLISDVFIPIALAARTMDGFGDYAPAWAQYWLASHWPSNCDVCVANGLAEMLERYDGNASSMDSSPAGIAPLLWTENYWSELAIGAIWLSAMCKSSDLNGIAKDALVEGILDGRAQPSPLAEKLVQLLKNKWLKLSRLADVLAEVSRVSLWTTKVVTDILSAVVRSWTEIPRDGHLLLTLLLEGLSQLEAAPSMETAAALKRLTPSGKSIKIVKGLLKLEKNTVSNSLRAALLEGVSCRVRRAQWSM